MPPKYQKLLFLLLGSVLALSPVQPMYAQQGLRVFYAGAEGSVKTALELAKFELVNDPSQADVFVLNGEISNVESIRARVAQGAGLVLFFESNLTEEQIGSVLGLPLGITAKNDAISITNLNVKDLLLTEIPWNSVPPVRERFDVITPVSSVQPLVVSYESGAWIVWRARPNEYVVSMFLNDANPQIQKWTYFNYLVYHLVERAARQTPLPFEDYSAYTVPARMQRNILLDSLAFILITILVGFYFVRRYRRRHPRSSHLASKRGDGRGL